MADKIYIPGAVDAIMHIESDGVIHVEHKQDCQGILDYTKAMRDRRYSAWSPEGTMRYEGEIPFVKAIEWAIESGTQVLSKEWYEYAERRLNSADHAGLRGAPHLTDPRIIIKGLR